MSFANSEWKVHSTDSKSLEETYGVFQLYSKTLNGSVDNLVVMAGFSEKSCLATRDVINAQLDAIAHRYKRVVIINLSPFKDLQTYNDNEDINRIVPKDDANYRIKKWENDIAMKSTLAKTVDKIIRANNLDNVHLLGKSAGGGLAMNVVLNSNIYKKLYLAVPAHPLFCQPLSMLGDRLNKIQIRIGWNSNDNFNLYDIVSNEQLPHYENILINLKKEYPQLDYVQCMFSPGNGHEVNPNLLYM